MSQLAVQNPNLPVSLHARTESIAYLMSDQVNNLTRSFQEWYDSPLIKPTTRRIRGRYWLAFLLLRFSGARLGEVLAVNDLTDVDFRAAEVKLITLKQRLPSNSRGRGRQRSTPVRLVPVPSTVMAELGNYLAQHPDQRGKVFKLDQGNFRKVFYERAAEAGIPRGLDHPHVLRHTRAIEMTRLSVPLTGVQSILGHSSLNTTAHYTRMSNHETKEVLRRVGLI